MAKTYDELAGFQSELARLVHYYGIDMRLNLSESQVAEKVMQFLDIVRACEEESHLNMRSMRVSVPPANQCRVHCVGGCTYPLCVTHGWGI